MKKFIDLSVSLEEGITSDPDFMLPKINYHHHKDTAEEIMSFFPGLKKEDLPGGEGWAMETITVSTHNGTHMDAPYHYHSTMDNGNRAITIDEVPLEWCYGKGVKFDFRSFSDGYVDQFGGPVGKKLKYPKFRKFLLEIHKRPMNQQPILLDEYIEEWKNECVDDPFSQIDDMTVVGFKI